jgi:integrase
VLDINKTDEPRSWALDAGVAAALRKVQEIFGAAEIAAIMTEMAELRGDQLRDDLKAIGITRPELFEKNQQRDPVTVHSLRATFVTLALAAGKSETWVSGRTGHKSSLMINH